MSEYNRGHGKREASGGSSQGNWWSRYRSWVAGMSRGQRIRYRLLLALVVVAVIIIALALFLRSWIKLPEVPELPGQETSEGETGYEGAELPQVAMSGRKEGYYTFLVAGQDVISGGTDTIMLISYDTKNKEIHAISLLRDTMINTSASSKRLNAVYSRNRGSKDLPEAERVEKGMTALKQDVSKLTGIYPDFYVLVQWEAIGELVDAIGGVYFEVPFDMKYTDPAQDLYIDQKAGYRLLSGEDAMEVIRFRKSDDGKISLGDSGRTEIQRDFLTAVLEECLQPDVLLKLPTLAQIFTENVNTDLSVGNILAFAQLAVGMDPETDVTLVSIPWTGVSYRGASMVLPVESELLELLNDGINPYVSDIQSSDLQLMYKKSDGSFGVTNGTLADPSMGRPASQPKPEEPEQEPEEQPQEGETTETGESGAVEPGGESGEPQEGGSGSTSETGEPDTEEPGTEEPGTEEPVDSSSQPQGGGSSQSGDASQSQGQGEIAPIDPSEIFPEVDTPPSQDIPSAA